MTKALNDSPQTRLPGHETLIQAIQTTLYPDEIFPRSIFPTLEGVLEDHFVREIQKDGDASRIYKEGKNRNEIKNLVQQLLDFRTILSCHPNTIVLIYRPLIMRFLAKKQPNAEEREDLLQEVTARLISKKLSRIQERYDCNFKKLPTFTSYFMVTVRNIYIDIIRERNNPMYRTEPIERAERTVGQPEPTPLDHLLINEELTKFHYLLSMYHKSRAKIEICLKLKNRIQIGKTEAERFLPQISDDDISQITDDFRNSKEKDIFKKAIEVFNKYTDKIIKSDTLRKWTASKSEEIMKHMNKTHDHEVYNAGNFSELVNLYYKNQDKVFKMKRAI